jgi:hypothetical protein
MPKLEVILCDKCGKKIKGLNYTTMGNWYFCGSCARQIMKIVGELLAPMPKLRVEIDENRKKEEVKLC